MQFFYLFFPVSSRHHSFFHHHHIPLNFARTIKKAKKLGTVESNLVSVLLEHSSYKLVYCSISNICPNYQTEIIIFHSRFYYDSSPTRLVKLRHIQTEYFISQNQLKKDESIHVISCFRVI